MRSLDESGYADQQGAPPAHPIKLLLGFFALPLLACFFPQHGPGMKHTRPIYLARWQQKLAETWPDQLLKGMVQSDGCRFINTGRDGWRHPRYSFSNVSTDVTSIFCSACDCLGLRWTASFPSRETAAVSIYVSRKDDVARLDEFVGPKR